MPSIRLSPADTYMSPVGLEKWAVWPKGPIV